MYKSFFGLRENPFRVNPDPRYLYLTPQTQKTLDQLKHGVRHCKGLILLTGEVGTGKTTLVHSLLNWLKDQNTPTALIFNSRLTVNHLFDFILTDFGVPIDFRLNGNMLMRLNLWLMERFRAGKKPVLIIDEAQGLSIGALEEIRLLLNLETAAEKLLQIVLVGQPELEDLLKRSELRQLRQRIEIRCSTAPLKLEESRSYIAERLRIAGADGHSIFSVEAMDVAYLYSKGIPRVLNLLCEHALINAYSAQSAPVPIWAVEEAAREFLLDESSPVAARNRGEKYIGGDPPELQPKFEKKLERPFATEGPGSPDRPRAVLPSAPAAFAKQEPATAKVVGVGAPVHQPTMAVPWRSSLAWIRELRFMPKEWTSASAVAQRNKLFNYLTHVSRFWLTGFRRDWRAMMDTIQFPGPVKSLIQWLRQPVISKRLAPSRKQPL